MRGAAVTRIGGGVTDVRRAGVGLRLPHLHEVAAGAHPPMWFEVHPENFLSNPHARELLQDVAARHTLSLHTVGLSVGSADGLDRTHLAKLRALADELRPVLVSGHLAWSTHRGRYLNDLLPLPYNEETLRVVTRHIEEVQQALGRVYVLENPASYVGFTTSTMSEVQFLAEVVARTGCRLLCDVSNAYLSAANMGYDAYQYIDDFPDAVAELHLGGFTAETDEAAPGGRVLIDTHAACIAAPVWDLYAHTLRKFGAVPTMIEWDNDIPELARLAREAARADAIAANAGTAHAHVG